MRRKKSEVSEAELRDAGMMDAAIAVLGQKNLLAVTARRVDRAAGLAEGSTSEAYPTRAALLFGVAKRLESLDRADCENHPIGMAKPDEIADALAAYVVRSLTARRARTLARYALSLEAASDAELREPLRRLRARRVTWCAEPLADLGLVDVDTAATRVIDYLDGMTLRQVGLSIGPGDPRGDIGAMLKAVLARPAARYR